MIPALGKLQQEDCHLCYRLRPYVKRTEPGVTQAQTATLLALSTCALDPSPAHVSPTHLLPLPLPPVFVLFSFTSVVDLVIALQEDGYMVGFMDFYTKEVGGGYQD